MCNKISSKYLCCDWEKIHHLLDYKSLFFFIRSVDVYVSERSNQHYFDYCVNLFKIDEKDQTPEHHLPFLSQIHHIPAHGRQFHAESLDYSRDINQLILRFTTPNFLPSVTDHDYCENKAGVGLFHTFAPLGVHRRRKNIHIHLFFSSEKL